MQTATAAEYQSNVGHDFTLADAEDSEYLEGDEVERRRVNQAMAEYFGLS